MIKRILKLYKKYTQSPIEYAREIGVKIGNNCQISGKEHWSSEPYLIEIGNNVVITKGVLLHTHGGAHVARNYISGFDVFGKICIEDNVYIGNYAQIMPGVRIGEGSLIAAGAIVTKSVPPKSVVGGNPAKYICSTDEYIKKNAKYNTNTYGLNSKEKKKILLKLSDDFFIKKNTSL